MDRAAFRRASLLRVAPVALIVSLGLGVGWGGARPGTADVLVTRDGARVETDGPWKEKGRLVVFTRPDGTLASLRASEVDLEASRQATEEAHRAAEDAAAEETSDVKQEGVAEAGAKRASSRWSFTDSDFSRRRPASATEERQEETPSTTGEPAEDTAPPEVVDWDREFDPVDQHVAITGTLANRSTALATAVGLEVTLYDDGGEFIESRQAELDRAVLRPGQQLSFRADFPYVYNYKAVRFRSSSTNLAVGTSTGARTGAQAEEDAVAEEAFPQDEPEDTGGGTAP